MNVISAQWFVYRYLSILAHLIPVCSQTAKDVLMTGKTFVTVDKCASLKKKKTASTP